MAAALIKQTTVRVGPARIRWNIEPAGALSDGQVDELRAAWNEDVHRSPFVEPGFLMAMAAMVESQGGKAYWARAVDDAHRTVALWPLALDRRRVLRFLQQVEGDHCTCLCRQGVSIAHLREGLTMAIKQLHPVRMLLVNIPSWGPTLRAARAAVSRAGWSARTFPATPCPVMAVNDAADLAREINRHKRIRNYENRLKKHEGFAFEVLTDDSDLDAWTEDFCNAHEWRWNDTDTPSKYVDGDARQRFLDCLRTWADQEVLVRFAIRLSDARVALVAALRQDDRLVYYHVVTSPVAEESRAGHVLIRRIALWMAAEGYTILDFGVGGEEYKHRYANRDDTLWRLHAVPQTGFAGSLHGWLEEKIRGSNRLQRLWDDWANQRIRGKIFSWLRRARNRLRIFRKIHFRMSPRELVGLMKSRLIREDEVFFTASGRGGSPDSGVVELKMIDVLTLLKEECSLQSSHRAQLFAYHADGARPFGVLEAGRPVHVSWIKPAPPHLVPEWVKNDARRIWSIEGWRTAWSHRDRGVFQRTLNALLDRLPATDQVILYTHTWDRESQRSFVEAGFRPLATRRRWAASNKPVFRPLFAD